LFLIIINLDGTTIYSNIPKYSRQKYPKWAIKFEKLTKLYVFSGYFHF